MSVDENKALIRRFYEEVWDRGNTDFAYEVFAEDYVRHDRDQLPRCPGPVRRGSRTTFVLRFPTSG